MTTRTRLMLVGMLALGIAVGCYRPDQPTSKEDDPEPAPTAPPEDLKVLAEGNNAFAIDLYKKLAESEKGNIVLSPYSIRTALAMTYAGARGQTADEMKKVLHFTLSDENLHPAFGASAHQLQGGKDKPYTLNVANALWGQKGFPFRPEFLELNKKNYAGGFREVDFISDPGVARQTINRWVEEKTQDKVKELLTPDDITGRVVLVLTNATYFKGEWGKPFPKERTRTEEFEAKLGEKAKVLMMSVDGKFRAHTGTDFALLELPYQGGRFSMVVLLPHKRCGLTEVEKSLTVDQFRESMAKLSDHNATVTLPKFKTRSRFELVQPLMQLGMISPFTDADFSGIAPGLGIANVIHAGDVEVDERGTEAAAATVVILVDRVRTFRADHPFLYFIVDRMTGAIQFLGRFSTAG